MSLKDRLAVLQQHNAHPPPAAAVGHAAPLRAKIAQFESKGGVPIPRGSFGIGAPPVLSRGQEQQKRGELYGIRMKPVWVPNVPPPSLGKMKAESKSELSHRREESISSVVDRFPTPPDSPAAGSTLSVSQRSQGPVTPEVSPPSGEVVETDTSGVPHVNDIPELPVEADDEDAHPGFIPTPLPSPTSVVVTVENGPHTAKVVPPPLPSPPLSVVDPPASDESPESSAQYGTVVLQVSPAQQAYRLQGQSFSSVVHGRVREHTYIYEKKLPPTPLSPGYVSYSDLTLLAEDAAALERQLVAGELPAEALRRLSARLPSANQDKSTLPTHAGSPLLVPNFDEAVGVKTKHTFRNPLARKRSIKKQKEDTPAIPIHRGSPNHRRGTLPVC